MDYSAACQWLGIDDPTIELDESILKSVFRRTAVHEHPDKSHHEDATQRFQMVKRAHDFLIQCVGRGETGPNAPSYTDEDGDGDDDDDEYYYEDDEDDDDNDFVDLFMAHIFATGGGGVHFSHGPRGGPTVHVPFPGAFFGAGFGRPSSSFPSAGMHDRGGYDVYDNVDDVVDDDDDDNYHRYYERKQQQAKRKTEAAKHKAEAEELQKAEAIQRAMEEGRDCFEMWTVKALNQEATRRGFNIRGLQKESILHLLIEDERQKRKKRQLKEVAPLLDEWVEIIIVNGGDYDASRNKNLNGLKARAVNYEKDTGLYTVEWDDPTAKKKSQQHRHMYGDKTKQASLKPENLILWGSRPPRSSETPNENNASQQGAAEDHHKKKSRRERKEAAKKRQEEQQAKKEKQQTENSSTVSTKEKVEESSMDQYERLVKEMASTTIDAAIPPPSVGPSVGPSAGYILHKVKCPLDKKPGDVVEFSNPHIPGQRQRTVVPADAKPGKFFKVNVQLPAKRTEPIYMCARCVKQIKPKQEEGVFNFLPLGLPLRSCVHHCCEDCFPNVQDDGKCPTCSSALPKPESLDHLPCIQQFDNPPTELKEAFIEEFFAGKETERSSAGKKEQEALEEASSKATKAVEKHYRRASIKVHPDRYGDEFRKEFDKLTKARDILRDTKLRRKYLSEMIDIACRVDPGYIPQSHQIWVEKNITDATESYKPPPKPGKSDVPLYLDGGVAFSQAKRPRSFVQNEKLRQVRLYLPVSGIDQFIQYCESVTVIGNCGNLEEDETILIGITKSELDIQDSEIRCNVTLPVNGIWDISWCSFLMIDGVERRTPYSAQARIDIRSKAQLSMAERRNGMETLARHFTNEIRCRLHSHKLVGVDDRQKIEASLSSLHWGISKGRDVAEKLLKILRSVAVTSSPVYEALITMLKEANEVQAQLLESVLSYDKRDSRRAFKNSIASKLEHGGSESWMSGVTAEELLELGGDANRLYQLLIEGKKASSLAFDDSTIDAASKREDIFSTKQREELHERKLEVEALLAEEMEKAVKKENEENELKRMETMANRLNLKRGAYVKIQGLEGRSDLNGSLGTYMGVAHGERYTVRIHIVEQDFALKSSKFKEWDLVRDGIPFVNKPTAQTTPWSCGTCTYMHQGSLAHKNHCAMCDTAKGEGSSGTTGGGWNNQATEGKNHPEKAPEKSKLSTKSERLNDIKTPSPPKPDNYNDVATPSQAKPKPENVVNASPAPADQLKAYLHQSNRHCELGIFCADLRRGPEACRFEHLPEEIAVYHPEHPSAIAAAVLDIPLQPSNKAPAQVPKPVVEPQPKKSPAESAQKSSIASGPMDKRAGIRCKYRAACFNLKRGPDKCKHFHIPDEIARYHHTASGPEKMGAHVISSKLQPKPVACCKHGVDCNDLRMGPSKCRFFHPMEEISVYHPNFMTSDAPVSSSAGSQESTSISENKKKDVYRNLLVGADIAPVIVGKGGKRILALRKKSGAKLDINRKVDANGMCTLQISGTAKSVEEAIKLVDEILLDNSKVSSENTQQYVHRNIIVEANTISILIGDGGRLVKSIMNKTGTKITVSRDADSNGCCTISITGGAEAVQMAAKLVVDASLGANGSSGLGSTEDMSLLSELTGDDLIQARPNTVAPTSSEGENGLLAFLLKHKSSLKCSPLQFHKSLKTDDILNLLDLAEACEDEEYTSVLQEYGLKGFKRGPFVKAVHRAAATISS